MASIPGVKIHFAKKCVFLGKLFIRLQILSYLPVLKIILCKIRKIKEKATENEPFLLIVLCYTTAQIDSTEKGKKPPGGVAANNTLLLLSSFADTSD